MNSDFVMVDQETGTHLLRQKTKPTEETIRIYQAQGFKPVFLPRKISFSELKKSLQHKEVMTTIFYPDKTKEIKTSDFMIYKDYKAKLFITKGFMFGDEAEFFKDDDEEFKSVCKNYRIQFNIKITERRLSE